VLIDKTGCVQNVIVLENTTGSKPCADAASAAAFKSRYFPARRGNVAEDAWIIIRMSFENQD
jgi:hypothetical protein